MSGELLLLIRIIVVKFQQDIASVSGSGDVEKKRRRKKKKKKKKCGENKRANTSCSVTAESQENQFEIGDYTFFRAPMVQRPHRKRLKMGKRDGRGWGGVGWGGLWWVWWE